MFVSAVLRWMDRACKCGVFLFWMAVVRQMVFEWLMHSRKLQRDWTSHMISVLGSCCVWRGLECWTQSGDEWAALMCSAALGFKLWPG